jgi:hypothetical protein
VKSPWQSWSGVSEERERTIPDTLFSPEGRHLLLLSRTGRSTAWRTDRTSSATPTAWHGCTLRRWTKTNVKSRERQLNLNWAKGRITTGVINQLQQKSWNKIASSFCCIISNNKVTEHELLGCWVNCSNYWTIKFTEKQSIKGWRFVTKAMWRTSQ